MPSEIDSCSDSPSSDLISGDQAAQCTPSPATPPPPIVAEDGVCVDSFEQMPQCVASPFGQDSKPVTDSSGGLANSLFRVRSMVAFGDKVFDLARKMADPRFYTLPEELPRPTVAGSALPIPEKDQRETVQLDVPFLSQAVIERERGLEENTGCYATSVEAIKRFLGNDAGPLRQVQFAQAEDHLGRVTVDPEAVTRARSVLDENLEAGRPVLVGISCMDADYNNDLLTDHFVVAKGRGYDDQNRLYYQFMDPAAQGDDWRMYVDCDNGNLFKEGTRSATGMGRQDYQMTQVISYGAAPTVQAKR